MELFRQKDVAMLPKDVAMLPKNVAMLNMRCGYVF